MLVSIIIPVYNVKQFLPKCLDSVIEQSYRDLEIIVVDDGSTDGSGAICDEYAKKDNRIKVIHQSNKGLSGARNTALNCFNGEYVCFVDSDDWVEENYIQDFIQYADLSKMVCCGYNRVKCNRVTPAHADCLRILKRDKFVKLFIDNSLEHMKCNKEEIVGNYAWNKMWPRKAFDNIRFPVGHNYEDIYVFIELLKIIDSIVVVPNSNYNYRIRENSIDSTPSKKNLIDAILSRIKQEEDLWCYSMLISKAKILTLSSICGLFAAYYKGGYDLTREEKMYYKKLIFERIEDIPRFKYNKLYLKCFLNLYANDVFRIIYKIKKYT